MILSCDSICIIFWNAPKSNKFIFGSFSVLKLITCQFFEMLHFICWKILKCPFFSIRFWNGRWGISIISNIWKWGISKKLTRDQFLTKKEPKIKWFDSGSFQKIRQMLSNFLKSNSQGIRIKISWSGLNHKKIKIKRLWISGHFKKISNCYLLHRLFGAIQGTYRLPRFSAIH